MKLTQKIEVANKLLASNVFSPEQYQMVMGRLNRRIDGVKKATVTKGKALLDKRLAQNEISVNDYMRLQHELDAFIKPCVSCKLNIKHAWMA